ncbi:sigma factor-like helix-turn-helix DNA-binding protein [Pseudomonas sp. CGJS7]|uniref:sigma factor-like helix-turn-helix DNA-binding protein n=1 Tax=Pseudomonas sp. CGJS7 TaxID=3109348 RepID=UPI00300B99B4
MKSPDCVAPADETPANADRIWSEFLLALSALPPQTRAAFVLHEVFAIGYDDIARWIGQSPRSCREHVERGRALTRSHMRPLWRPRRSGSR